MTEAGPEPQALGLTVPLAARMVAIGRGADAIVSCPGLDVTDSLLELSQFAYGEVEQRPIFLDPKGQLPQLVGGRMDRDPKVSERLIL